MERDFELAMSKGLIWKEIRIENSNSTFRFHFIVEISENLYTFTYSKAVYTYPIAWGPHADVFVLKVP